MIAEPKSQSPKFQSPTILPRNICRGCPTRSGILRELLQNADDAGASTVVCQSLINSTRVFIRKSKWPQKFVLDRSTHSKSPLLHEELSQHQGPALLAYNDTLVSEKDLQSLAFLDGSKQVEERSATGNSGFGFSSVSSHANYLYPDLLPAVLTVARCTTGPTVLLYCPDLHYGSLIRIGLGRKKMCLQEGPNTTFPHIATTRLWLTNSTALPFSIRSGEVPSKGLSFESRSGMLLKQNAAISARR
jgi:hypothetical protein